MKLKKKDQCFPDLKNALLNLYSNCWTTSMRTYCPVAKLLMKKLEYSTSVQEKLKNDIHIIALLCRNIQECE